MGADSAPTGLWGVGDMTGQPLEELLGRTRAAVLEEVADGCSTTDLARRVRLSASSASQHATVLRKVDLITTGRDRPTWPPAPGAFTAAMVSARRQYWSTCTSRARVRAS
ncbi:winged helix-turn-helix domain-containing protein [Streptomyces venezuelae]